MVLIVICGKYDLTNKSKDKLLWCFDNYDMEANVWCQFILSMKYQEMLNAI